MTIKTVPPELAAYGPQRQDGYSTGRSGVLRLGLARGKTGRTVVKEQYSQVPLLAQKAMYLEESLPAMAYMYVISPSGGVLQGDSYSIDVSLGDGAMAHLTTQGATRVYRMERGFATQQIEIFAGAGSYFEYIPDQIIPYRGSRLYQKTAIRAHDEATVVYSDIVAPGRAAMGESFQYDVCYLRVEAADRKGRIKFADASVMEPKKRDMKAEWVLGRGSAAVGAAYVLAPARFVPELGAQAAEAIRLCPKVRAGCSALPRDAGISVRMLGGSAGDLRELTYRVAAAARKVVLGAGFSAPRKG